jgi:hypothetical protein
MTESTCPVLPRRTRIKVAIKKTMDPGVHVRETPNNEKNREQLEISYDVEDWLLYEPNISHTLTTNENCLKILLVKT